MSEQHTLAVVDTLRIIAKAFESGELAPPAAAVTQGHDGLDLAIVLMLIARTLEDSREGGVRR